MSGNLLQPLQPHALEQLETFLKTHKTEETFDLVGLNGFVHGIIHLSQSVSPSVWIKTVLTDEMIASGADTFNEMISLVFGYFNSIAIPAVSIRATDPDQLIAPICDGTPEQTLSWLRGFAQAFSLDKNSLTHLAASLDSKAVHTSKLLMAHMLNARELESLDKDLPKEHKQVGDILREFKPVWEDSMKRMESYSPEQNLEFLVEIARVTESVSSRYRGGSTSVSVRREGPKVGRNDPCPCGSGLKYKKCHGK
jgi:yecA family protein